MADPILRVPEFIIIDTIEAGLEFIRNDYESQVDKQNSYLYKLVSGIQFQRFNLFEQAEQIICCPVDDPRRLIVDLMFNMQTDGVPSVHVTLPAESTDGQGNGLGFDQGYIEDLYNDDITERQPIYTRRFQTTYNIVITSDNTNEVIFLFHFIRALLIAMNESLSLAGLENVSYGGQDIQPYSQLIPVNLFMRAISMNLQYETSSIRMAPLPVRQGVDADGKPVLK